MSLIALVLSLRSRLAPVYVSIISFLIAIICIDVVPKLRRNLPNEDLLNRDGTAGTTRGYEYMHHSIPDGMNIPETPRLYNYGGITYASAEETDGTDTFDIRVKLWTDPNCFYPSGTRLYAPSQSDIRTKLFSPGESEDASASAIICYANEFSNASVAFDLAVVRYSSFRDPDTGQITPRAVNLRQYRNHCRSSGGLAPIQAKVNQCTAFMGGKWATFNLMQRSTKCTGAMCSTLKLVKQQFYSTTNCAGAPMAIYKYPIQGECLRYAKGTQTFSVKDAQFQNLTEKDYEGAFVCDGPTLTYNMRMDFCYTLYGNRGFKWSTDADYLASNARALSATLATTIMIAAFLS